MYMSGVEIQEDGQFIVMNQARTWIPHTAGPLGQFAISGEDGLQVIKSYRQWSGGLFHATVYRMSFLPGRF